ncbi:MAG: PH domain-containing protein [Clostridiales bacterium]|nr:PH domain-containing protein [Clostridiales bacterium]
MAKRLEIEKAEVLWNDRKRWLGMPLSFTRYEVSGDRLVTRKGFFNTSTEEILIYRIMDVRLTRSFGQKIFGVGTVTLLSTDKSCPSLELKNIKRPEDVRVFLSQLIERERSEKGISSREFIGGGYGEDSEADF